MKMFLPSSLWLSSLTFLLLEFVLFFTCFTFVTPPAFPRFICFILSSPSFFFLVWFLFSVFFLHFKVFMFCFRYWTLHCSSSSLWYLFSDNFLSPWHHPAPPSSSFLWPPTPPIVSAVEQRFHVQSQGRELTGLPETSRESAGGFEPPREKVRRRKERGEGWREEQQHRGRRKQKRKKTTENNMLHLLPVGRRGEYFNIHFSRFNLPVILLLPLSSVCPKAKKVWFWHHWNTFSPLGVFVHKYENWEIEDKCCCDVDKGLLMSVHFLFSTSPSVQSPSLTPFTEELNEAGAAHSETDPPPAAGFTAAQKDFITVAVHTLW